jgi:hypothetical protein
MRRGYERNTPPTVPAYTMSPSSPTPPKKHLQQRASTNQPQDDQATALTSEGGCGGGGCGEAGVSEGGSGDGGEVDALEGGGWRQRLHDCTGWRQIAHLASRRVSRAMSNEHSATMQILYYIQ